MAHDEKKIQNRSRITYMILSVVIAITAWILVEFTTNPDITKTLYNVNVSIRGGRALNSKGLVVINADEIKNLSVKISGKRKDMLEALDNTTVEIDVSDISEPGEYSLKGEVVLPVSRISVEKTNFSTIAITVDEYKTAECPLEISEYGNIPGKIVEFTSEKDKIEISGAKTELERIAKAVAEIEISGFKGSGKASYNIRYYDKDGEELNLPKTVSAVPAEIDYTVYDYKELTVKPVLHEQLKNIYEIDYENTVVKPEKVGVGVLPGNETEQVTVVIDDTSNEEKEYKISEAEGMYIPDRTVRIKAELKPISEKTDN